MPRQARHKIYSAGELPQGKGRGDFVTLTSSTEDTLLGTNSSLTATPQSEDNCCEQDAYVLPSGGRVGDSESREKGRVVDGRISSHPEAVEILGSVGPGAEPPVADQVSHAFVHGEPHSEGKLDCLKGINQGTVAALLSNNSTGSSVSAGMGGGHCEGFDRNDTDASQKRHYGKEDPCSRPASTKTNNEEEVDTLPESFNLSDEYGPEGASTGRNHQDDDDDDDITRGGAPLFIGIPVESKSTSSCRRKKASRGQDKRPSARQTRSKIDDGDSTSVFKALEEKNGGRGYASVSDSSISWYDSPERLREQPHLQFFGWRTDQSSRRRSLNTTRRNSRIVPSEDLVEPRESESVGARRHRHPSGRNSAWHRSPPRRRYGRDAADSNHPRRPRRRGDGRLRIRDSRNLALTETERFSAETHHWIAAEMTELRRENEALKQQRGWSTRLSGSGFDVHPWNNRYEVDGHLASMDSSPLPGRRHDKAHGNLRYRERLTRDNDALRAQKQLQHEQRQRLSYLARDTDPSDVDISSACASSRRRRGEMAPRLAPASRSDSVKSNSPPRSIGPTAWGVEPIESTTSGFELSLPHVLVSGGFLWKVPYHNAGTPKRRWFQIKPAEGLLTTASGRLVVQPTAAGCGGGGGAGVRGWGDYSAYNDHSGARGSDREAGPSMSMMRLRAAWPLALMWVDPERDLKRSPPREIGIEEIVDLARGHKTPAFWQQAAHRGIHTLPDPKLCFSLMGHNRTLDLAAESLAEAKEWVCALATVVVMVRRGGLGDPAGDVASLPPRSRLEPAAKLAYLNPKEKGSTERLKDFSDETISRAGVKRRPNDGAAAPLHGKPCQRDIPICSKEEFMSQKAEVLGEGGVWSVDTIRAWRGSLFPAVMRGDIAAVLDMFDQGCPVDLVQTGTGDTPMLLACRLGDVGMVRECLRRGARNDPHPAFGQTALQAAVASGHEACTRLILETAAPSRSDAVVSNHKDPNEETPLHVACRRGYCGIVEALLHHGADLRAVDRKGNTPLHGAAGNGHAGALASLLDAGGDVVLEQRNARGGRALHAAAACGHIACVELLLGTAAEPDIPDADGQTPFVLAFRGGHLAITRLIRQYAPAAGTPAGTGAQFQARRRSNGGGGSATTDALPRPHANGCSSNGPGISDQRSRDLEHSCYSAVDLDHRQHEEGAEQPPRRPAAHQSGGGVADRELVVGTKELDRSGPYSHHGESNTSAADSHLTSSTPPSSARVHGKHGSLFDGLQVYVVGSRQPLGSQHTAAVTAPTGVMSALSPRAIASASARTMELDSQRLSTSSKNQHYNQSDERQQHRKTYPSNQHASSNLSSFSTASSTTGGLDTNWRHHVLSAPSTMAPSPPIPMAVSESGGRPNGSSRKLLSAVASTATRGDDVGFATAPGSARALARMIHFSSNNNHSDSFGLVETGSCTTSTTALPSALSVCSNDHAVRKVTGPGGGSAASPAKGGGDGEAPTKAIGSWMTSVEHDQDTPGSPSSTPEYVGKNDCGGTDLASTFANHVAGSTELCFSLDMEKKIVPGHAASGSGEIGRDTVARGEIESGEDSFVIAESDEVGEHQGRGTSAALSGFWRVFQLEGCPYYVHEASGHSQWEDPRERVAICPQDVQTETGVTENVGNDCLKTHHEPKEETVHVDEHQENIIRFSSIENEQRRPPPASPITPTAVPVAVTVARFVAAATVSRRVAIAARDSNDLHESTASEFEEEKEELNGGCVGVDGLDKNLDHMGQVGTNNMPNDCGSMDSRSSIDRRNVGRTDDACSSEGGVHCNNIGSSRTVGSTSSNNGSSNNNSNSNGGNDICRQYFEDDITRPNSQRHTDTTITMNSRCEDKDTGDEAEPGEKHWHPFVEPGGSWPSLPPSGKERATAVVIGGVQSLNVRSPEAIAEGSTRQVIVDDGNGSGGGDGVGYRGNTKRNGNGLNEEEEEDWWQELNDEAMGDAKDERGLPASQRERGRN